VYTLRRYVQVHVGHALYWSWTFSCAHKRYTLAVGL